MTAIAGLITWLGIGVTYIRFYQGLKAQGFDRRKLPYWTRLQPFAGYYTVIATFVICLVRFRSYQYPISDAYMYLL